MIRRRTRKFCISALRKAFGFNKNLISVNVDNRTIILGFHNQVNGSKSKSIDHFEMYSHGCDLNFFEEFADSCIDEFNCMSLSDKKIIAKAKFIYHKLVKWFKEKKHFEQFLYQRQSAVETAVQHIKDFGFIKVLAAESNHLIPYGQYPVLSAAGLQNIKMLLKPF